VRSGITAGRMYFATNGMPRLCAAHRAGPAPLPLLRTPWRRRL